MGIKIRSRRKRKKCKIRKHIDIDYQPIFHLLMLIFQFALIISPRFRGKGGHGIRKHGTHGWHSQSCIGWKPNVTFNFRQIAYGIRL